MGLPVTGADSRHVSAVFGGLAGAEASRSERPTLRLGRMPANLTPEYKAAEAAFRRAGSPSERLEHLREMLRVIPKHKGTEHLQAEIKKRIKELAADQSASSKAGARTGPPTYIASEGAGQIALLGPPNSGESTLHAALTGSQTEVGPYPFTTQFPQPGMYVYEEIPFQIVDLPAISAEHPVPWIVNALQPADACLLVVDVSDPDCVALAIGVESQLRERKIVLTDAWPAQSPVEEDRDAPDLAAFTLTLPTLRVAAKSDLVADHAAELDVLEELAGFTFPALAASAKEPETLGAIGAWLAANLEIVRVYTKIPGQPADLTRPFTVRYGQTVADVARLVHREMAASVKYARVWGNEAFDGQQVDRDHVVADGDVLELHT